VRSTSAATCNVLMSLLFTESEKHNMRLQVRTLTCLMFYCIFKC
jgi:hypothetical protein